MTQRVSDERLASAIMRDGPDGWACRDHTKPCHDGCASDGLDLAADLRDARAALEKCEAECAAMREALGDAYDTVLTNTLSSAHDVGCYALANRCEVIEQLAPRIASALTGTAGAALLKVVRAAAAIGAYPAFDPACGAPHGFWRDVNALLDAVDEWRGGRG